MRVRIPKETCIVTEGRLHRIEKAGPMVRIALTNGLNAMVSALSLLKALLTVLRIIIMNAALGDVIHDRLHFV